MTRLRCLQFQSQSLKLRKCQQPKVQLQASLCHQFHQGKTIGRSANCTKSLKKLARCPQSTFCLKFKSIICLTSIRNTLSKLSNLHNKNAISHSKELS